MNEELFRKILELEKTEVNKINSVLNELKTELILGDSFVGNVLYRAVKLYYSVDFFQCKPGVLTKFDKLANSLSEGDRSFTFYFILNAKIDFLFNHFFYKEIVDSFKKQNAQLLEIIKEDSYSILFLKHRLQLFLVKAMAYKGKTDFVLVEKKFNAITQINVQNVHFVTKLTWYEILVFYGKIGEALIEKDWLLNNMQHNSYLENYLCFVIGDMYNKMNETQLALVSFSKCVLKNSSVQSHIYFLKSIIQRAKLLEEQGEMNKVAEFGEMFYKSQPSKFFMDRNLFKLEFDFVYGRTLAKLGRFTEAYDFLNSAVEGEKDYSLNRINLFDEVFYYILEKAKKQKELEFSKRINQSNKQSQSRFKFTSNSIEDVGALLGDCFIRVDSEIANCEFDKANEIIQAYSQLMRSNIVLDNNILRSLEDETGFLEIYIYCNCPFFQLTLNLENIDEVLYSDYVRLPHGVLLEIFKLCFYTNLNKSISELNINYSNDEDFVFLTFLFSSKVFKKFDVGFINKIELNLKGYLVEVNKNFLEVEVELIGTDIIDSSSRNQLKIYLRIKV